MVDTRKALYAVLSAVNAVTRSYGAPEDRDAVRELLRAHETVPWQTCFHVGGILFGNFFAYSDVAFGSVQDSLWQEIQKRAELPDMPKPSALQSNSKLLLVAGCIQDYVEEQGDV